MTKEKHLELLVPVESLEKAKAAVLNGADAVYTYEDDFTETELKSVIDYCHLRAVKVYICINILYKNDDINQLFAFMKNMYDYGADAFIVQDLGMMARAKVLFPKARFHASARTTVHDISGVLHMAALGFDRVVLARELSLDQIKEITEQSDIEIETFIHGEMCYSYSGMCRVSSIKNYNETVHASNRDSHCEHSCRKKYNLIKGDDVFKAGYLLSTKDLMGLDNVKNMVDFGVSSIKIEGRKKSPEYIAQITKNYRDQIDSILNGGSRFSTLRKNQTRQTFSRGFTDAHFKNSIDSKMMNTELAKQSGLRVGEVVAHTPQTNELSIKITEEIIQGDGLEILTKSLKALNITVDNHYRIGDVMKVKLDQTTNAPLKIGRGVYRHFDKRLDKALKQSYKADSKKLDVKVSVTAFRGDRLGIRLKYKEMLVTQFGEIIDTTQTQPTSIGKVIAALSEENPFPFKFDFVLMDIEEQVYIDINDLQFICALAAETLEVKIRGHYQKKGTLLDQVRFEPQAWNGSSSVSASVVNTTQLEAVVHSGKVSRVYFEANDELTDHLPELLTLCHSNNIELFVSMQPIIDLRAKSKIMFYETTKIDGYLVNNYGYLEILKDSIKKIVSDYGFNISNSLSAELYKQKIAGVTLSPEIEVEAYQSVYGEKVEVIVYGYLPVVTTHSCPVGMYVGNKAPDGPCDLKNKAQGYYIQDELGDNYQIVTHCNNSKCVSQILDHKPINQLNKLKDIRTASVRLMFHNETDEEILELLNRVGVTSVQKQKYKGHKTFK